MISLGIPMTASQGLAEIEDKDVFKHIVVMGGTGKGKSTAILNLISKLDGAKIILDPNGSLAELAHAIHPEAVYINKRNPISLNPLTRGYLSNSENSNELVEVLNTATKVTSEDQVKATVLMAKIVRNAVRIGIKDLKELSDFLEYEHLRKRVNDNYWKAFDDKDGFVYKNREARESAKRISARLSLLTEDEHLLPFGQGNNNFSIDKIVENSQVYIFDFRGFDDFLVAFLGGLVATHIKSYHIHQATQQAKPLYFFVDEVHLFFSGLFSRFLAECRKYNIAVIMSLHSYSQLSRELELMIEASCHTKIILKEKFKAEITIGDKQHLVLCDPPPKLIPIKTPEFQFMRDDWCHF